MQMTGWLVQQLWPPQPGLLALLEEMVLGAKEEVSSSATTRAEAGLGGQLLVFTPNPSSFFSSQPWPSLVLDNRGGVPWHQKGSWPFTSYPSAGCGEELEGLQRR